MIHFIQAVLSEQLTGGQNYGSFFSINWGWGVGVAMAILVTVIFLYIPREAEKKNIIPGLRRRIRRPPQPRRHAGAGRGRAPPLAQGGALLRGAVPRRLPRRGASVRHVLRGSDCGRS